MSSGSSGYPGWGVKRDETSTREHFKEVEEDVRHDREAEQVAKRIASVSGGSSGGSGHADP